MSLEIFSRVQAVVTLSYLDKIPDHIDQEEFLRNACNTHNVTLAKKDDNQLFFFRGLWKDMVLVEAFLRNHLKDWSTENQPCQFGNEDLINSERSNNSAVKTNKDLLESGDVTDSTIIQRNHSCHGTSRLEQGKKCSELTNSSFPESQKDDTDGAHDQTGAEKLVYSFNDCTQNCEKDSSHENEIYMDIKLSHRPSHGLFKDSETTPLTVVMGTEKSLIEAVCLESTGSSSKETNFKHTELNSSNKIEEWKKVRNRQYEERAEYKFFCNQCSFKTKRQSHLQKHALLHERVCKLYSCEHCEFSTMRLGHLQRHRLLHADSLLSCSICNFKTHSRIQLQRHRNLKHNKKEKSSENRKPELKCPECDYMTTREKLFERHQIVHSRKNNAAKRGSGSFKCSQCPYSATTKSNLGRHLENVHNGDRPYLCNICGQGFKRSDTLTQHLVIHSNNGGKGKNLQCPHCPKFYRSKYQLHEHILSHSDARSYLCEICGAAFKTRSIQSKHIRLVHGKSDLFPCSQCPKKFKCKFELSRHMKKHRPKAATETTFSEAPKKPPPAVAVSDGWAEAEVESVVSLPVGVGEGEEVQVVVVQEDNIHQQVFVNDGAIFVQDTTQVQTDDKSSPSESVTVLPVEYVLPEEIAAQLNANLCNGTELTLEDGEVITLQFVD